MGLFVAGLVIIIGIVAVIAGVDGTGLTLFEAAFGVDKTGQSITPQASSAAPSTVSTTNPQGVPWTQVVAQ